MPAPSDDEIFGEAIELPPAERDAYLDRACAGDPARRARLASLLAGHAAATHFLEQSPAPRLTPLAPEEKIGDTLGHYTLLRKIGEGGCGVVYLAEQSTPVRRRVALKVIKLGLDTRSVITRFEAERQVLAMMEHPDIARVYDAGATATGRPYFVMEFVDGVPITRFCDEHSLPTTARLELFARVCLALQHAHQKGVIHRDIKPSNILVALHDGVPLPKIIDFGIAKATAGHLTDHTLLTGLEQFIGTPAYMSPEQAERRDLDIDTRSDVYSLGVLLYELLTGRPPFDPKSLVQAGVDEIRRIIREVDPPRPSTRLSTLAAADRATVARLRGAAPTQLSTTLRGDLDWIVMRCLEKPRDRRYGTAHELAADIRRHLRSEPIAARPPSAGYRLQKFIARHRLAVASAAALLATLVLGTFVSVRQAIRATRAEHAALAERDAASAARAAETLARADAQRRQGEAEDLLAFMLGDFRAGLEKIGQLKLLDAVGEKAMAYFAALDPRDLTDPALTRQAKALSQIGEVRLAEARYADATAAFAKAHERAAALLARHPQNADMLFERAQAEYWLGLAARRRGDFETCRTWFTRYRDSALALATLEGPTLRARTEVSYGHHNLAYADLDRGQLDPARTGFLAERTLVSDLLAATPDDAQLRYRLADIASSLGTIAERDGAYPEALAHYQEMTTRLDELATREPTVARWRVRAAESRTFTGNLHLLLGDGPAATADYAQAWIALSALAAQDRRNRDWSIAALTVRLRQAGLFLGLDQPERTAALLGELRPELEALLAQEPASRLATRFLMQTWRLEAALRFRQHQPGAADAIARSLALGETYLQQARGDRFAHADFAQCLLLAGRIAAAAGQPDTAHQHWTRLVTSLATATAGSRDARFLDPTAQALVLLGRPGDAQPLLEQLRQSGYHTADPLAAPPLPPLSSSHP